VLDGLQPPPDILDLRVARELERRLEDHGSGVDVLLDEVHGHSGDAYPVGECLFDGTHTGERRQE
jgi:hypothetical protein